jgi:hypothetical protein
MDIVQTLGWQEIALRLGAGVWSVSALGLGLTLVILILGKPLERSLHRRFPKLSDHNQEDWPPHA